MTTEQLSRSPTRNYFKTNANEESTLVQMQCDQIGRFFGLWATIQSLWQKLLYPNRPHC